MPNPSYNTNEATSLYFLSSREWPWRHRARPKIHAARRLLMRQYWCVSFWTREKTHKLRVTWQASFFWNTRACKMSITDQYTIHYQASRSQKIYCVNILRARNKLELGQRNEVTWCLLVRFYRYLLYMYLNAFLSQGAWFSISIWPPKEHHGTISNIGDIKFPLLDTLRNTKMSVRKKKISCAW